MIYNAKEHTLNLQDIQMDYITFGKGAKPLVMIQGLSTRSINGTVVPLAYMYRIFAKDYKVYLFDRRKNIHDGNIREILCKQSDQALLSHYLIFNNKYLHIYNNGKVTQYLSAVLFISMDFPDRSIYICLMYFCPSPVEGLFVIFGTMLLLTLI